MKKYILLGLLLFLFSLSYAQAPKNEKQFLTWFFTQNRKISGPVLYVPVLWKGAAADIKNVLKSDTIYNRGDNPNAHDRASAIFLSKKERKALDQAIQKLKKQHLPDRLTANARSIEQDTVDLYFKDRAACNKHNKRDIRGYFSLTRPIFLRNNTICIFQYSYNCGPLCGDGATAVYKKVNGKWAKWISLSNWVS